MCYQFFTLKQIMADILNVKQYIRSVMTMCGVKEILITLMQPHREVLRFFHNAIKVRSSRNI